MCAVFVSLVPFLFDQTDTCKRVQCTCVGSEYPKQQEQQQNTERYNAIHSVFICSISYFHFRFEPEIMFECIVEAMLPAYRIRTIFKMKTSAL